jgi:hypothetical protein
MKKITFLFLTAAGILLLISCRVRTSDDNKIMPVVTVKTEPVFQGDIEKTISFNGKTIYLKKNVVVSPIAGYVVRAAARFGEDVKRGDLLFEIQTRESKALGTDSSFAGNIGTIKVTAPSEGFINELSINETGGYVVEGGILCSIVDNNDLIVKLNVPFEYNSIIKTGKKCKIILPDETSIDGVVNKVLLVIDEANQTQSVLIRPGNHKRLPENLNLTIIFIQEKHEQINLVYRTSLMTNETQSEFWVMKIFGDTLAVRIPVIKGIENDSITEISSPFLGRNDFVIKEGAYGLPDSTVVKIEN